VNGANVVDSSGWLEYFADTPRASLFAPAIQNVGNLIVPTITMYEVFKKFCRARGEHDGLRAVRFMERGRVIELDSTLAIEPARFRLPLGDSIIYATAVRHQATLWTQDEHFADLPGVPFFPMERA
jgi:predicted nucleic acid-binding protein